MAGKGKLSARQAFNDNLRDAEFLVALARALENKRGRRRMRRELRDGIGGVLGIPKKHRDSLDCIESDELFVVFKPGSNLDRQSISESNLRSLHRQALVAACATVETFVSDRVMERLPSALDARPRPTRLLDLPMTVGDWIRIEEKYERRRWGLREVIEARVQELGSSSPGQIGMLMEVIGGTNIWRRIDERRGVTLGVSESELTRIHDRREQITRRGDRSGRGRAVITADEVERDLKLIVEIVDALDTET